MAKAISNKKRKKIIKSHKKGSSLIEISTQFKCHRSTVDRIIKRYYIDGNVDIKKRGGNVKPKLKEDHIECIQNQINADPSIKLEDLKNILFDNYQLDVSKPTIHRLIKKFNFIIKREYNGMDIQKVTNEYYAYQFMDLKNRIGEDKIFLADIAYFTFSIMCEECPDESYARAKWAFRKKKVQRVSAFCIMSKNGILYFECVDGINDINKERELFLNILEELRLNRIENTVILLNQTNMIDTKPIIDIILDYGHEVLLPPKEMNSKNPVERLFELWKREVYDLKPENEADLTQKLPLAIQNISQNTCEELFDDMVRDLKECLIEDRENG